MAQSVIYQVKCNSLQCLDDEDLITWLILDNLILMTDKIILVSFALPNHFLGNQQRALLPST